MEPKRPKLTLEEKDVQKECQEAEIAALKQKLVDMEAKLMRVTAELEQVKNERAYDKINFETEKCELESKIDKYKEQCSELQRENEKLRRYLQDLESSNIQSPMNFFNTNLNSRTTKVMNERYPETRGVNHTPGTARDYPPRPMPFSNPLCPSGVGFASNMSASHYPSTASTSGNLSNSSYPASSSPYLPVPTYPVCTSSYSSSTNSTYPRCVLPYPASSNSRYTASSSSYHHVSSNNPYPASGLSYADSSNRHYAASFSSPYPIFTSVYPDRHYPAPSSMKQLPSSFPYPSMGSRGYTSQFGPSVNEANYDAWNFNDFPNEIIEKIFCFLTQNQLGQIARVCRKWSVLTKSPVLWRKIDVKIFCSSDRKKDAQSFNSLIDGLPSCVTFIKLDFDKRGYLGFERGCMEFEKLCMKLHQNNSNVEAFILARCDISTSLPGVINSCTHFLQGLKKLVLHNCHFVDYSGTEELNDNSTIKVLDLSCSSSIEMQFSKLPSLTELRLASTKVDSDWFVGDTSFLNQLHVLDLGWTFVHTDTFLPIQRHGQNLKELYLCKSGLWDLDLDFSGPVFPHLQTICLSATLVTREGLVSLVESCPSLVSVYADESVAEDFAEHPFVVANRCKSGIVKSIDWLHNHRIHYSPN